MNYINSQRFTVYLIVLSSLEIFGYADYSSKNSVGNEEYLPLKNNLGNEIQNEAEFKILHPRFRQKHSNRKNKNDAADTFKEKDTLMGSSINSDINSESDYSLKEDILQGLIDILKRNNEKTYFLPKMITSSSRIQEAILDFKDEWLQETWEDATWEELEDIFPEENDCKTIIKILPCIESFTKSSNIIQISKHTLNLLMSYTVALEQIFLDEILHENRIMIVKNLHRLLKEIKSLAVTVIELLEIYEETPDEDVVRYLTTYSYDSKLHLVARKIRATAFIRQIEKGITYINNLLTNYKSSVML